MHRHDRNESESQNRRDRDEYERMQRAQGNDDRDDYRRRFFGSDRDREDRSFIDDIRDRFRGNDRDDRNQDRVSYEGRDDRSNDEGRISPEGRRFFEGRSNFGGRASFDRHQDDRQPRSPWFDEDREQRYGMQGRGMMQQRHGSSGYGSGGYGEQRTPGRSLDEMESSGWQRDDYGFRGPSFRPSQGVHSRGYGDQFQRRDQYGAQNQRDRSMRNFGSEYEQMMASHHGSGPMPSEAGMRASGRGKGPKDFTRSDDRVREDVCELLEDCDVDASNIEVRVNSGEVILQGSVDSRWAKREAEDTVSNARGVKQIHNQLRVVQQQDTSQQQQSTQAPSTNGSRQAAQQSRADSMRQS